jgi:hypothetical protein
MTIKERYVGSWFVAILLAVAAACCLFAAAPLGALAGMGLGVIALLLGAIAWAGMAVIILLLRRILMCLEAILGDGKMPIY